MNVRIRSIKSTWSIYFLSEQILLFVITLHAYLFFQWIIYWKQPTKCCVYKITTIPKLLFYINIFKIFSQEGVVSYEDEALCLFLLPWLVNDRGMLHVDCLYNYYYEYFLYFIVTQILLNQHVNCFKSYFYFFLYCIATQIPPHLYNLRIGVGWANLGVCYILSYIKRKDTIIMQFQVSS